jgi:hypothetical protein
MKLVIQTQIKENYGAHDWDGKGECPQGWKFKGGNTYVVERILPKQAVQIVDNGIPHLKSLVESADEYFEEYVISYDTMNDSSAVCEPWETPIVLKYDTEIKQWIATKTEVNGEYGYMRSEIAEKTTSWVLGPEGEQVDTRVMWLMENGERGIGQEFLKEQLNKEVA